MNDLRKDKATSVKKRHMRCCGDAHNVGIAENSMIARHKNFDQIILNLFTNPSDFFFQNLMLFTTP